MSPGVTLASVNTAVCLCLLRIGQNIYSWRVGYVASGFDERQLFDERRQQAVLYLSDLRVIMGKSLVIVESPAKAKTINKYLGNDYVVKSSVGHVRDLPTSGSGKPVDPKARAAEAAKTRKMSPEAKAIHKKKKAKAQLVARMGIDPDSGWSPNYQVLPGKEKVVDELRKLAKDADSVILATD